MEAAWLHSGCDDRISDLPESVILHILSFLPIKDVIRTNFLSRRWRFLWTSVPTLDFDGLVFSPKTKFIKFVDSVMLRRNCFGVQKFCLRFGDYYCDSSHAQSWISTAIAHNVQELAICYYIGKHFELPICVFSCKSLRLLKLNLHNCALHFPSSMHLPLLNTLHLTSITFSDNTLTWNLFSNCPMLKKVIFEDFIFGNLAVLHILSSSLERLIISFSRESNSDNRFLEHEIRISTPMLLSLKYTGYMAENVCLENGSSLVDAAIYLNFNWKEEEQLCGTRVCNFLRGLYKAKFLTISSSGFQLLSAASNLPRQLPIFYNLNHLNFTAPVNDIREISCFLHSAPNLEFLSIEFHSWIWCNKEGFGQKIAPFECVIDHLRDVKIKGFWGGVDELVFVKVLLDNASVLQRMTIVPSKQLLKNSKLLRKTVQIILKHPRRSTSSEVSFS